MLHATPYDINHADFYFSTFDEYQALYEKHICEEFEIQFIDGDNPKLFSSAQIDQSNLKLWFEDLEIISDNDNQAIQIQYLLEIGFNLDNALSKYDGVHVYHGSASDYACEIYEECYNIPDYLIHYIDYDAISRDMIINGEITEYSHEIFITNSNEF